MHDRQQARAVRLEGDGVIDHDGSREHRRRGQGQLESQVLAALREAPGR